MSKSLLPGTLHAAVYVTLTTTLINAMMLLLFSFSRDRNSLREVESLFVEPDLTVLRIFSHKANGYFIFSYSF